MSDDALGDVMAHVLEKGYQAGSLVGTAVVAPIVAYRARTSGSSVTRVLSAVAVTALVGIAGAGLLGTAKIWGQKIGEDGLQDRARKLRRNVGQHRTDVFSKVGSAMGAAAGGVALGPAVPAILGGAAIGGSLGVLAHVSSFRESK